MRDVALLDLLERLDPAGVDHALDDDTLVSSVELAKLGKDDFRGVLGEIFDRMTAQLNAERARDLDAVVHWHFSVGRHDDRFGRVETPSARVPASLAGRGGSSPG